MKTLRQILPFVVSVLFLTGCSGIRQGQSTGNDVNITFLQMNDVYEISPLEGGKVGGLARVGTIRQKLLKENKNTYTVLAGDFLSPSVLGTMKHEGQRIKGKHMVEVLNAAGLDLACFGNHEFDLKEDELKARINESEFDWISGNVSNVKGGLKTPFRQNQIMLNDVIKLEFDGIHVGILSVCIPANKQDYVHYEEYFKSIDKSLGKLKDADVIIGLTHVNIEDDLKIAERYPQISLIMGGHEHNNMIFKKGNATVAKADANAKTVYVHRLTYNKKDKSIYVESELIKVDDTIAEEGKTKAVADKWNAIAAKSFAKLGVDPDEVVAHLSNTYDAREVTIRNKAAAFPKMIARAMLAASKDSDIAIMNSGSIRVDDVFTDQLTQFDILRSLPFGGGIKEARMTGELLKKVLDTGEGNVGKGGFLQWTGVEKTENGWNILGKPLNKEKIYGVAITDYLLLGLETNLDFLNADNPDIKEISSPVGPHDIRSDIRVAVIDYLKKGGS